MSDFKELVRIISDSEVFEKIHQAKTTFTTIFSEVANELPKEKVKNLHHKYRGTKISKGNELQHCPYQVLDIIRDFDKQKGFNIRLLNWWGRGMYIMLLFGSENKYLSNIKQLGQFITENSYHLCGSTSPWDYHGIIDQVKNFAPADQHQLQTHILKYEQVQLVKKVPYESTPEKIKTTLERELSAICTTLRETTI